MMPWLVYQAIAFIFLVVSIVIMSLNVSRTETQQQGKAVNINGI